jgi:deoxyribodipyrimidine photolyase
MAEDKNLVINKRSFDISFYEMDLEFNNNSVVNFVHKKQMIYDMHYTSFFDNKNILEEDKLEHFKNHIYSHVLYFVKNVLNKEKIIFNSSWFQLYKKGSYHPCHIHGIKDNEWSLIYYIQISEQSSKTTIFIPGHPYVPLIKKDVIPKKDKLVVFPSYFPHEVAPNEDESRIILSANFEVF